MIKKKKLKKIAVSFLFVILYLSTIFYVSLWVHELTHKNDFKYIIKEYESICVLNDCSSKLDKICVIYGCSNFPGSWLGYYYNAIRGSNEKEVEEAKAILKVTDKNAYTNQFLFLGIMLLFGVYLFLYPLDKFLRKILNKYG